MNLEHYVTPEGVVSSIVGAVLLIAVGLVWRGARSAIATAVEMRRHLLGGFSAEHPTDESRRAFVESNYIVLTMLRSTEQRLQFLGVILFVFLLHFQLMQFLSHEHIALFGFWFGVAAFFLTAGLSIWLALLINEVDAKLLTMIADSEKGKQPITSQEV